MVVQVAKQFLHGLAACFDSPKLELHIGDGFEFLKGHRAEFDVIITDSSDPIGPAESLFGKAYYELVKEALRDGGVLASQGGNENGGIKGTSKLRMMPIYRTVILEVPKLY